MTMKMVRTSFLAAAAAASLLLAGCATSGSGGSSISVSTVQNAAVTACGFLPTVSTVANLIASNNALVSSAESIASAICAAVAPAKQSGKFGAARASVNGVAVRGKFVR